MLLLNQLNTLETTGLIRLATVQPELEYLFRHALVQDAAYGSLLKQDRRRLHQSVGEMLEKLYPHQLDELAPTLAFHFEKAGAGEKALQYFTRAGDRASESYANAEASAFYQSAITQTEQLLSQTKDEKWQANSSFLWEKVADLSSRAGQHDAAREHYYRAHDLQANLSPMNNVMPARLLRKIGATHTVQRQFAEAAQVWAKAENYLGVLSDESVKELWDEWIEIQVERTWGYYWQSATDEMEKTCRSFLPIVEQRGTAEQRARAFGVYNAFLLRRERYVVSDRTIISCLKNLQYALESRNLQLQAEAYFGLGFCHLFRQEFSAAEENMQAGLKLAEQIGSPIHISRCANYLMLSARMRGKVELAQSYFPTILSQTWAGLMSDYRSHLQACQAWIAWRAGKLEEARELAAEALEKLQKIPGKFPLQWIAVFLLLSITITERQLTKTVELAQLLLDPSQMILPRDLTDALEKGLHAAQQNNDEATQTAFAEAITLATSYGYL